MDTLRTLWESLQQFLGWPVLRLGGATVSLWTIAQVVLLVALLLYLSGVMRLWLSRSLGRTRLDVGARETAASIARYIVVLLGVLIILQTAGIDLTTLNVLAGAVGLGVGIGLQSIAANFISGLILMFERPVKIGDRIDVAGVEGDVVHIGARSTTVVTNDNIAIIIPNSRLVSENVVNWSHTGETLRFTIPLTVAYGTDPRLAEELLLSAARECADVLTEPAPTVRLAELGDHGLRFELRVWSTNLLHRKGVLTSSLNFAIYEKVQAHGVEIPYPQRVVHLRELPPLPTA